MMFVMAHEDPRSRGSEPVFCPETNERTLFALGFVSSSSPLIGDCLCAEMYCAAVLVHSPHGVQRHRLAMVISPLTPTLAVSNSLAHSRSNSLTYSLLTHSLSHSLAHSLTGPVTLTHSLVHPPTH